MKTFILGLLLGLLLGTAVSVTYAAMASGRQQREFDKFQADTAGDTCILVTIAE